MANYVRLKKKLGILRRVVAFYILRHLRIRFGIEINCTQDIGAGLKIAHGQNITIGAGAKIGSNVTIYNGVTLGAKRLYIGNSRHNNRYPNIEAGVTIFSGAKVLGAITIGKNSIVGANAVVLNSFPENSVIAGVPARLIKTNEACH